jgi:hypothetical protein
MCEHFRNNFETDQASGKGNHPKPKQAEGFGSFRGEQDKEWADFED